LPHSRKAVTTADMFDRLRSIAASAAPSEARKWVRPDQKKPLQHRWPRLRPFDDLDAEAGKRGRHALHELLSVLEMLLMVGEPYAGNPHVRFDEQGG
jgi:hypothetical protein